MLLVDEMLKRAEQCDELADKAGGTVRIYPLVS